MASAGINFKYLGSNYSSKKKRRKPAAEAGTVDGTTEPEGALEAREPSS